MSRKRKHRTNAAQAIGSTPEQTFRQQQAALASADAVVGGLPFPTLDAFTNSLARIGYGTPNLMEGVDYVNTRLTRNFQLLNTLYRSHWIPRKIIDLPAEDMVKNWYQLATIEDPKAIDKFKKLERRTATKAAILRSLKWGRLYGGGAAIMMIRGHEDFLDQSLDLDEVLPGSYCGLLVVDRWSGVFPGAEQVEDPLSADFGLPSYYQITVDNGRQYRVHHSRVLRFTGRELPFWERQAEVYWGLSEIELVMDELKKRDNTSWNIAGMVFLSNIRILKLKDLAQSLAVQNSPAQQRLYNTLQAQNHLMSNMGLMALNSEDEFQSVQFSGFRGLADIHESFVLDICGAAEIPAIKLFGRSPSGIGDTGKSDLQAYYDGIKQKQEAQLEPVLDKLLPVMAMSCWGEVPEDLDHKWLPPETASSDELANLAKNKADTIINAYNSGLLWERTAKQELRQLEEETGLFSNITDEEIAQASEEDSGGGEMGGMGGLEGLLGGNSGGQPPGGTQDPPQSPGPKSGSFNPAGSEKDSVLGGVPKPGPSHFEPLGAIKAMRKWIKTYLKAKATQQPPEAEDQEPPEVDEGGESIVGGEERAPSPPGSPDPLSTIKAMRQWISTWLSHHRATTDSNGAGVFAQGSPPTPNTPESVGWIGVDLDGTTAHYDGWKGWEHIGKPIPTMVDRIKERLAQGADIRIFTARAAPGPNQKEALRAIEAWCLKHLGQKLPVTNEKDMEMRELWDDRAVGIKKNAGEPEQKTLDQEPSPAQIQAGNYPKEHKRIQGLDISIENPKGSTRRGVTKEGQPWETVLKNDYDYIRGTVGKDKDHVDVFLGPDLDSPEVFIIDQVDPSTKRFDEHKVVLGCKTQAEAVKVYRANYQPGWDGLGAVTHMDMDKFKRWLETSTQGKSASGQVMDEFVESDHPRGQPDNPGQFTSKGSGSTPKAKPEGTKPAPGTPASQITEGTQVNAETMGQVQQRVLAGNKGIRSELRKILAERIKTEGLTGRNTFQDWMSPGKMGARLYQELITRQGMTHKQAKEALQPLLDSYEWRYKQVLASHTTPMQSATRGEGGQLALANGQPLPEHIARLKIPPAWTDLRINPDPEGALLVEGRDAKSRLVGVYHERFKDTNAQVKFQRIKELAEKFPAIQAQNEANRKSANPLVATHGDCMRLIMEMGIRPGSDADTKAKVQAYGATTLGGQHVKVGEDGSVTLQFVGKKGVALTLPVEDPGTAAMIKERAKSAGPSGRLFPGISQKSLLSYSGSLDGGKFTPKDFRTHLGTKLAQQQVTGEPPKTKKEYVKRVKAIAKTVAAKLGNTPAVALSSYISPVVFSGWLAQVEEHRW